MEENIKHQRGNKINSPIIKQSSSKKIKYKLKKSDLMMDKIEYQKLRKLKIEKISENYLNMYQSLSKDLIDKKLKNELIKKKFDQLLHETIHLEEGPYDYNEDSFIKKNKLPSSTKNWMPYYACLDNDDIENIKNLSVIYRSYKNNKNIIDLIDKNYHNDYEKLPELKSYIRKLFRKQLKIKQENLPLKPKKNSDKNKKIDYSIAPTKKVDNKDLLLSFYQLCNICDIETDDKILKLNSNVDSKLNSKADISKENFEKYKKNNQNIVLDNKILTKMKLVEKLKKLNRIVLKSKTKNPYKLFGILNKINNKTNVKISRFNKKTKNEFLDLMNNLEKKFNLLYNKSKIDLSQIYENKNYLENTSNNNNNIHTYSKMNENDPILNSNNNLPNYSKNLEDKYNKIDDYIEKIKLSTSLNQPNLFNDVNLSKKNSNINVKPKLKFSNLNVLRSHNSKLNNIDEVNTNVSLNTNKYENKPNLNDNITNINKYKPSNLQKFKSNILSKNLDLENIPKYDLSRSNKSKSRDIKELYFNASSSKTLQSLNLIKSADNDSFSKDKNINSAKVSKDIVESSNNKLVIKSKNTHIIKDINDVTNSKNQIINLQKNLTLKNLNNKHRNHNYQMDNTQCSVNEISNLSKLNDVILNTNNTNLSTKYSNMKFNTLKSGKNQEINLENNLQQSQANSVSGTTNQIFKSSSEVINNFIREMNSDFDLPNIDKISKKIKENNVRKNNKLINFIENKNNQRKNEKVIESKFLSKLDKTKNKNKMVEALLSNKKIEQIMQSDEKLENDIEYLKTCYAFNLTKYNDRIYSSLQNKLDNKYALELRNRLNLIDKLSSSRKLNFNIVKKLNL